jgi:hypothetical protein
LKAPSGLGGMEDENISIGLSEDWSKNVLLMYVSNKLARSQQNRYALKMIILLKYFLYGINTQMAANKIA